MESTQCMEISMTDAGESINLQPQILAELKASSEERRSLKKDIRQLYDALVTGKGIRQLCEAHGDVEGSASATPAESVRISPATKQDHLSKQASEPSKAENPRADSVATNPQPPLVPGHFPGRTPEFPRTSQEKVYRVTQQEWEDREREMLVLQKQVAEQAAKISSLQKFLIRAGRKVDSPMDSEVRQQFVVLRSNILQFVKTHCSSYLDNISLRHVPRATHEFKEMWARSRIAGCLMEFFFSPHSMLFGYNDHMGASNPLRFFEEQLKMSQCDDAQVREWRTGTIKAARFLGYDVTRHIRDVSRNIWHKITTPTTPRSIDTVDKALEDLESLCKEAYDLGLLFRSSSIEYQWEQDLIDRGMLEVLDEYEVVCAEEMDPKGCKESEVALVVFGAVVRGDKGSGLLAHGRTKLCAAQVVIRGRPT